MSDCDVCGFEHYPVEVYRQWLRKHTRYWQQNKLGEQRERWKEIVKRHGLQP